MTSDHPLPPTLPAALERARRRDPARPLVTYYDDATGERVELSVATFANWVNKIANLLVDDLMLEPGSTVAVDLPLHWQATVTAVGAWTAGLTLELGGGRPVDVRVVGPEGLPRYSQHPDAEHVLACSLRPLGGRFTESLPAGWLDFAVEVPPQADGLVAGDQAEAETAAVSQEGRSTTQAELVRAGTETASVLGLTPGGRLVTDHNPSHPDGVVVALVAPLVAGAAVVLVAPTSDDRRTAIATQERATVTRWTTDG